MNTFKIDEIIQSLKSTYGKDFLDTITMQLHQSIGAQFTFIAKLDQARYVSRTLSLVAGDDFAENFEYSLEHTPCADVSDDSTCIYPSQICDLYPKDQLLVDMGIEGYVGAPLHSADGKVFGIVVALYSNSIENAQDVAALFELFAGRISAELERSEKEEALRELNESLEQKVIKRTAALNQTIEQLKASQAQLVEQEKLASLGRLVAGVAHEVNTPLGVAVLGTSTLASDIYALEKKFTAGAISKHDMETYFTDAKEMTQSIEFNLARASELIGNFKQMATDFHCDEQSTINVVDWLSSISTSLKPMLKKAGISLILKLPESSIVVTTYPSRLAQVITNIISNTVKHAFPSPSVKSEKSIVITLSGNASEYSISMADNGVGMSADVKAKIFDPFFTTNRVGGGMGLGMSIVHNLVTNSLNGRLMVNSHEGTGTDIQLLFKG
ncbi:GAF domain-containing sensor histidine kinase [Alteromonas sp. KUL49]|uniref:GAF domain-containing sensor histidine kinase n=1 Tax=Alteromonas sp. KUL49 TaxID=2480798 RepID=UPI00102F0BDD|nr:GAF domain-containing sensor histidine kinase [Alteromonas sp. KUL49]TAP34485.1 sensor histidine kinase [Alteromonas sp. KUL49]GEA13534.1 diguanylate cyclase [Alteromonas sp. KUL49]